jgi:ComF family protein
MACSRQLNQYEEYLCRKCRFNLPRTRFENLKDNPVFEAFWGRVSVVFAAAVFYFRKGELVQQLIHRLKYRRDPDAGIFLGKISGYIIRKSESYKDVDVIVPVPLHPKKRRIRGYNQCEMLARGISEVLNLPVSSQLMLRIHHSSSQTRKTHYERWVNVENVFDINDPSAYAGKHILLIDDVITTGATLEACCNALLRCPGVRISVLTIGYASR